MIVGSRRSEAICAVTAEPASVLKMTHARIAFKRTLIFEVSCLLFEISGQRFAKFAVDLNEAIRELGKASLECFRDVLVLSHVCASNGSQPILGTIQ